MKRILTILLTLFIKISFAQTVTVPCSYITQKVEVDSLHRFETTFQRYGLHFFGATTNDTTLNKPAFNSTSIEYYIKRDKIVKKGK